MRGRLSPPKSIAATRVTASTRLSQVRHRQPSTFAKLDIDQPQWLRPHPQPLSQAGFIFLMKASPGEGTSVRYLRGHVLMCVIVPDIIPFYPRGRMARAGGANFAAESD